METKEMYLCLETVVGFLSGKTRFVAGKVYEKFYEGCARDENGRATHTTGGFKGDLKPVKTFEHDGVAWILHEGDRCPVPEGWEVAVLRENGTIKSSFIADRFCNAWKNGRFFAYRITSTGEQDYGTKPVDEDEEEEELPLAAEANESDPNVRPLSPQEAAFAAKQEQLRQDEAKQTLAAYKPLTMPAMPEPDYFPAHVGGKRGGC